MEEEDKKSVNLRLDKQNFPNWATEQKMDCLEKKGLRKLWNYKNKSNILVI